MLGHVPRRLSIKLSLSVLVPKPNTPLAEAPLPDARDIVLRVRLLKRLLPRLKIQEPSWKEAQIEYDIDHFHESDIQNMVEHIEQEMDSAGQI